MATINSSAGVRAFVEAVVDMSYAECGDRRRVGCSATTPETLETAIGHCLRHTDPALRTGWSLCKLTPLKAVKVATRGTDGWYEIFVPRYRCDEGLGQLACCTSWDTVAYNLIEDAEPAPLRFGTLLAAFHLTYVPDGPGEDLDNSVTVALMQDWRNDGGSPLAVPKLQRACTITAVDFEFLRRFEPAHIRRLDPGVASPFVVVPLNDSQCCPVPLAWTTRAATVAVSDHLLE